MSDRHDHRHWHHRRQRPVRHGRADRPRRADGHDAVRRSVGPVRARHAARQARRVPGAARRRASAAAVRAELPREHLRLQDARRRVDPLGERGRQPEGGVQAARHRRPRSVLRSHARAASARSSATASSRTSASRIRSAATCRRSRPTSAQRGRRHGAPRRHLRLHGRAAVLDAGRVEAVSRRGAWTSSA